MKQVQLDTTLVGFNQAIARLQQCVTCWGAVPADRRTDPARFALLVHDAEHALETEQASWVQQMKLGLDSLLSSDEAVTKTAVTALSPLDVEVQTYDTPVPAPTAPPPAPAATRRRRATVGDELRQELAQCVRSRDGDGPSSGGHEVEGDGSQARACGRDERRFGTARRGRRPRVVRAARIHTVVVGDVLAWRSHRRRAPSRGVVRAELDASPVASAQLAHQHADDSSGAGAIVTNSRTSGRQHLNGQRVKSAIALAVRPDRRAGELADQRAGPRMPRTASVPSAVDVRIFSRPSMTITTVAGARPSWKTRASRGYAGCALIVRRAGTLCVRDVPVG